MTTSVAPRLIVVLLLFGDATPASDSYSMTVKDARPVWKCAMFLEEKYGWRITYEDPPLVYKDDLIDVTSPEAKQIDYSPLVLLPATKSFTFKIAGPNGSEPERQQCLNSMIADYAKAGQTIGFKAIHQGDLSHIIATNFRDRNGVMVHRASLLDTRISFPSQERSLGETLALILKKVHDETGVQLTMGNLPINLMGHRVTVEASGIPARDALILAFNDVSAEALSLGLLPIRMSWALLYQADQGMYYFNAHGVAPHRPRRAHQSRISEANELGHLQSR